MDHPDLPTSRRTFSEPVRRRGLRDVDLTDRVVFLKAAMAGVPGFVLGGALGVFLTAKGMAPGWVAAMCPFLGAGFVSGMVLLITYKVGDAASTIYSPSGRTTPPKREYSRAEALVARGLYPEAITAFELAVAEDGRDPLPYLRVARVYRDHLTQHQDAARWFKRALRESEIPPGLAALARKELVELYAHQMGEPQRALPELARMAEELEGTEEGGWAAGMLAEIKSRMERPGHPDEAEDPTTTP